MKDIREILQNSVERQGKMIETGIPWLDNLTRGIKRDELIIVSGKQGSGKTAFAIKALYHAAVVQKIPVLMLSLDQDYDQILLRMLSAESGVNINVLQSGNYKEQEKKAIDSICEHISSCDKNIIIKDCANTSPESLENIIDELEKRPQLIIVDSMGQMKPDHKNSTPLTQLAEASRELKRLARDLRIPVIATSQMNRNIDYAERDYPIPSDLMGGVMVESSADKIVFVSICSEKNDDCNYSDGYNYDNSDPIVDIFLVKNKHGKCGYSTTFIHDGLLKFLNHSLHI